MSGIFLRDYYYWLADKASSPGAWKAVPPWGERLPLDIAYILRSFEEKPQRTMLDSIESGVKRTEALMGQLQNPPDSRRFIQAATAYITHRRNHDRQQEEG